jgi:hypothetical protein
MGIGGHNRLAKYLANRRWDKSNILLKIHVISYSNINNPAENIDAIRCGGRELRAKDGRLPLIG